MTPEKLRALVVRLGAAAEVVEASSTPHQRGTWAVPTEALDDLANAASAARDALGVDSLLLEADAKGGG